jgi:hypothetical protein
VRDLIPETLVIEPASPLRHRRVVPIDAAREIAVTNMNDSVSAYSTTPALYTMTRDLNWTGAVRGRGGYVFDNLLNYAAGGYLHGDIDHAFSTSPGVVTGVRRAIVACSKS